MSFEAKYAGTCGHGDRIVVGDLVDYDDEHELVHVECNAVNGPSPGRPPCVVCHLIHAGECF